MRPGAVPTLSVHVEDEYVRLRRHHPFGDHDLSNPVMMGDVAGEDGVDLGQRAGPKHDQRAGAAFLGWLKDEQDAARRRGLLQRGRRPQHHRHVGIVPAGMHRVRHLRREGKVGLLGAGQRVHLGPERHRRARLSIGQGRDDPAPFSVVLVRDSDPVELGHDPAGGLDFLVRQLGVSVELTPKLHHLIEHGLWRDCLNQESSLVSLLSQFIGPSGTRAPGDATHNGGQWATLPFGGVSLWDAFSSATRRPGVVPGVSVGVLAQQ